METPEEEMAYLLMCEVTKPSEEEQLEHMQYIAETNPQLFMRVAKEVLGLDDGMP